MVEYHIGPGAIGMKKHKELLAIALWLFSSVSHSHHSITPFDQEGWQEIEGVVTELSWRNPHLGLVLQVTSESGSVENWNVEGDAINTLRRRGLTRESFEVGQSLRLGGWPSTRGRREILATNVQILSGEEFRMLDKDVPLRWTSPRTASDANVATATDIFRVWSHVWSQDNPPYTRVAPFVLTEAAMKAMEGYDPLSDTLALKCIPPGMPNALLNPYPIQFIDDGDQIRLKIEEWNAERIIHMDVDDAPDDVPLTRLGYSIGRLNGNTLEINTSRLNSPYLDDDGIPMSTQARIYEEFTLIPEEGVLDYEVTVTDPVNLVEPAKWTFSKQWNPVTVLRTFECAVEE